MTVIFLLGVLNAILAQNPNVLPESESPCWPAFQFLEIDDPDTAQAQKWINEDLVITG